MSTSTHRSKSLGTLALVLAATLAATLVSNSAAAGCTSLDGVDTQPAQGAAPARASGAFMPTVYYPGAAQFTPVSYDDTAAIVGLWKFTFISKGNGVASPTNPPIPDGVELDAGYVTWHSDGTELTNSGSRAPKSGDFCMGVWKQVGPASFKLHHVTLGWNAEGTAPDGPGVLRELVTVSRSGNSYSGSLTIDQYDALDHSKLAVHLTGVVTATRITAD